MGRRAERRTTTERDRRRGKGERGIATHHRRSAAISGPVRRERQAACAGRHLYVHLRGPPAAATDYAAGASGRSGTGAISGRAAGANSHSRITLNRAMPPSTLAEATAIDSINAVGLSTTACSSRSTAEP